jgi:polysaccharide export outer membrane protein
MRIFVIFTFVTFFISSCSINKDLLFKSPSGFEYADLAKATVTDYKIAANDELSFQLFPNGGERLLALTTGIFSDDSNRSVYQSRNMGTYRVKPSGKVELPEIGLIQISDLTLEEAEAVIEKAYSLTYHDPYVLLSVTNNRVLVFPGEAGQASVITLENQNTTVLEALALAGGVRSRGIASKVKLIRTTSEGRDVFLLDLSTIEGVKDASLIVQANDIIYVSSTPDLASGFLNEITPIVSITSSLSLLYAVFVGLQ